MGNIIHYNFDDDKDLRKIQTEFHDCLAASLKFTFNEFLEKDPIDYEGMFKMINQMGESLEIALNRFRDLPDEISLNVKFFIHQLVYAKELQRLIYAMKSIKAGKHFNTFRLFKLALISSRCQNKLKRFFLK